VAELRGRSGANPSHSLTNLTDLARQSTTFSQQFLTSITQFQLAHPMPPDLVTSFVTAHGRRGHLQMCLVAAGILFGTNRQLYADLTCHSGSQHACLSAPHFPSLYSNSSTFTNSAAFDACLLSTDIGPVYECRMVARSKSYPDRIAIEDQMLHELG